jgi:enediyne biosynthesis protein E4
VRRSVQWWAAAWLGGIVIGGVLGCGDEGGAGDGEPLTCDAPPSPSGPPFIDATAELGIDFEHHIPGEFCELPDTIGGPGVCAFDYDGDADIDLYFADREGFDNRLFENQGDQFVDRTSVLPTDPRDSVGCLAFDRDGDGDLDLYVTNNGPDQLLDNVGGTFVDATASLGIAADGFSTSATAGDMDGDGDLDLFVGRLVQLDTCPDDCFLFPLECAAEQNLLFENRGGEFVEVSASRGVDHADPTLASLFFDFDSDGDLDLYAGNDMGIMFPDRLYENDGTGHFADIAQAVGFAAPGTDTMGIDVGDFDFDGFVDAFISDFKGYPLRVLHCYGKDAGCNLEGLAQESVEYVNWAVALADFDRDGEFDIFTTSGDVAGMDGDPNQLFLGDGVSFSYHEPAAGEALAELHRSRGAAFADLDGDGDLDVAVANAGGPAQVLLNQSTKGHGFSVSLDTLAAGARVEATIGDRTVVEHALVGGGYLGSSDPRLYFALGDACGAPVRVTFPGGETRDLGLIRAGDSADASR